MGLKIIFSNFPKQHFWTIIKWWCLLKISQFGPKLRICIHFLQKIGTKNSLIFAFIKDRLKCVTKMAINPSKIIQMTPNLEQYCIPMVSNQISKDFGKFWKFTIFSPKIEILGAISPFFMKKITKNVFKSSILVQIGWFLIDNIFGWLFKNAV